MVVLGGGACLGRAARLRVVSATSLSGIAAPHQTRNQGAIVFSRKPAGQAWIRHGEAPSPVFVTQARLAAICRRICLLRDQSYQRAVLASCARITWALPGRHAGFHLRDSAVSLSPPQQ